MATFRQVMNRVLTNLTEDEISGSTTEITDTYGRLVRNFINHIKEEMEDAHQWRGLQTEIDVSVPASAESADVTGAGDRARLVRQFDSRYQGEIPMVFNVTDADDPFTMVELDLQELRRRRELDTTQNYPQESGFFALNLTSDGVQLEVYPTSSQAQTIRCFFVIPQDRFAADASDLDTEVTVPATPLELGATWYALEERGEELGVRSPFSQDRYRAALDAAISRDSAEQGENIELVAG
jgi:hypothetical protein